MPLTPAEHAEELLLSYEGPCWHGPSLRMALSGVNAEMAAAHPLEGSHSIWELVLHLISWNETVLKRVNGGAGGVSKEMNFPIPPDPTPQAWNQTKADLKASVDHLLAAMIGITGKHLLQTVKGKPYDVAFMLSGTADHILYHAAQISLLKNALRKSK